MIPWSDNWWIDGEKAYFCGAEVPALFCVNLDNMKCELIARIPEGKLKEFRVTPFCVKYNNFIFCCPNRGRRIWYFDLTNAQWNKIDLAAGKNTRKINLPVICNEKMWIRNCQEGKITEIDLEQKKVKSEYQLPVTGNDIYGRFTIVHDELFIVSENMIFCINIISKEIKNYDLADLKSILFTIYYDGENFWLSGNRKAIYIWNPKDGIVKIFTEFPKLFGVYQYNQKNDLELSFNPNQNNKNFLFDHTIAVGKYMWFLPFFANQIVYIDRTSYKIHALDIDIKQGDANKKNNESRDRKLFEYVRNDRYIGVYSSKAGKMIEIDAENLSINFKEYELDDVSYSKLLKQAFLESTIFSEGLKFDEDLYSIMLKNGLNRLYKQSECIGEKIYKAVF